MGRTIKISGNGTKGIEAVKELAKIAMSLPSEDKMRTIQYTTIDKSTWGEGEWNQEPDKKEWQDEETSYPCLIVRAPVTGALCGYVGVPESHPLYGVPYNKPHESTTRLWEKVKEGEIGKRGTIPVFCLGFSNEDELPSPEIIFDVHGSLTFSGFCHKDSKNESNICHTGNDNPYWFGFDCSHAWDISPAIDARMREYVPDRDFPRLPNTEYRNLAYVTSEVESLARQLKELERV